MKGSRVDEEVKDLRVDENMNPPPKGLRVDNEKASFRPVDREIKGLRVDKKTGKPLPDVTPDASDEEEDLLEDWSPPESVAWQTVINHHRVRGEERYVCLCVCVCVCVCVRALVRVYVLEVM
jgi:hypothetical protein